MADQSVFLLAILSILITTFLGSCFGKDVAPGISDRKFYYLHILYLLHQKTNFSADTYNQRKTLETQAILSLIMILEADPGYSNLCRSISQVFKTTKLKWILSKNLINSFFGNSLATSVLDLPQLIQTTCG